MAFFKHTKQFARQNKLQQHATIELQYKDCKNDKILKTKG